MKFRSERSNRENGPAFSDFPLFPGIFQGDKATKLSPFTAEPKFPKNFDQMGSARRLDVFFGIPSLR